MAAPEGNQNAAGNSGGKSLNDRKLAADVRTLTLKQIFKLLSTDRSEMSDWEKDLYKQVFIKLSGTVLPRLNEHTGEDGEKLIITISKEVAEKNGITPSPEGNSQG
jgi:hypothetical protein